MDLYKRPYDAKRPQVCLDETSKQLIGETRTPVPAGPGREARYDHEYKRNGVANLFMIFEPLSGKRRVKVTERRGSLGATAKREQGEGELPIQHRRCADTIEEVVPLIRGVTEH